MSPESPLHADRLGVIFAELPLGNIAVIAFELLLGLQLRAEIGELALAALAVLAGAIFAAVDGALGAAPDVLAHAAVDFILGFCAFRHRVLEIASENARADARSVPQHRVPAIGNKPAFTKTCFGGGGPRPPLQGNLADRPSFRAKLKERHGCAMAKIAMKEGAPKSACWGCCKKNRA